MGDATGKGALAAVKGRRREGRRGAMAERISIREVNALGEDEFAARFGSVFEHSPWVAARAWRERPFDGLVGLHGALERAMFEASYERKLALIRAHPDLAGKAAIAGELTPESTKEQASAGLDDLSPEEYEAFTRTNREYREKFGFPLVIAVRGHTKETILAEAAARLRRPRPEEVETALAEISKIAVLRLRDRIGPAIGEDAGAPPGRPQETKERKEMAEGQRAGTAGGGISLGSSSYGKSNIRLVKVKRDAERHELWDLKVDVALAGDFEAAHTRGDNTGLLATDTMRNTVYALAKDGLTGSIEEFGLALVDHFLAAGPSVEGARVRIAQYPWARIETDAGDHPHSFVRGAGERTAEVTGDGSGVRRVEAGIDDLLVMKTTESGWEGFLREEYTTLPETDDRILATVVTANWTYAGGAGDYDGLWEGVRDRILATFTDHYSPSVQNTLYRIGRAVLEKFPEVEKIHLSFPNKHHIPYDLGRFGRKNDNEIFWATDEPYGLIEGSVEREP